VSRGLGNFRVSTKCGCAVLYNGVGGTDVVDIQRSSAQVMAKARKTWRIQCRKLSASKSQSGPP